MPGLTPSFHAHLLRAAAASLVLLCGCDRPAPLPSFTPVDEVKNTVYSDALHDRHQAFALLSRSEFTELQALLEERHAQYQRSELSANRLRRLTETIEYANGVDLTGQLDLWVARMPESALARQIRGFYVLERAWDARGGDVAADTPAVRMSRARELAELARDDFRAALKIAPDAAFAYEGLISASQLLSSDSEQRKAWFETAWSIDRRANPVVRAYFVTLAPEWGGSESEMMSFRNELAARGANTMQLSELDAAFHLRRSRHEYGRGNRRGAKKELRKAEGILATPNVLKGIAEIARMEGDMKEVVRVLERNLRENDPWDLWSMEALAQAYESVGRHQHRDRMVLRLLELHERYRRGV